MSDTSTESAADAPATEAPAAAPATEQAPATEAPQESFDREYVEKLRHEAAGRRTALKPYEEAFGAFDEQSRETYLRLAADIGSGDAKRQREAAAQFEAIAQKIKGAETPVTPQGEPDPDQQPMTRAEWKALQSEQSEKENLDRLVGEIEAEAKAAGIEPNTARYASYLFIMQQPDVAGDHGKALAALEAQEQSTIDRYAANVASGAAKWPTQAGGNGAPPGQERKPLSWKDARSAAAALASGRPGQSTN